MNKRKRVVYCFMMASALFILGFSASAAPTDFTVTITLTALAADQSVLEPASATLGFGMNANALDTVDNLDLPAPPPSITPPLTLKFTNNGFGTGMFTDVRAIADLKNWVLNVANLPQGATVKLDWTFSSVNNIPADADNGALGHSNLTITANGTEIDMKAATPRSVTLNKNGDFTISLSTGTNKAPIANNDSAVTVQGVAKNINVLANDSDPNSDPLTVTIDTAPNAAQGTATVNGDKTITFTPAANFVGEAAFTYQISDGLGGTALATVTVSVNDKFIVTRTHSTVGRPGTTFNLALNVSWTGAPAGLRIEEFLPPKDDGSGPWAYVPTSFAVTVGDTTTPSTTDATDPNNVFDKLTVNGLTATVMQDGNKLTFTFTGTPFNLPASPFTIKYSATVPATDANLSGKTFSGFVYEGAASQTVVATIQQTNMTVRTASLDVTGDGDPNNTDAVYIYRYLNNKRAANNNGVAGKDNLRPTSVFSLGGATNLAAIEVNLDALGTALDVTGDGVANNTDAVYIYRYLNNKRAANNNGVAGKDNLRPTSVFSLGGAPTLQAIEDKIKVIDPR